MDIFQILYVMVFNHDHADIKLAFCKQLVLVCDDMVLKL